MFVQFIELLKAQSQACPEHPRIGDSNRTSQGEISEKTLDWLKGKLTRNTETLVQFCTSKSSNIGISCGYFLKTNNGPGSSSGPMKLVDLVDYPKVTLCHFKLSPKGGNPCLCQTGNELHPKLQPGCCHDAVV